MLPGVSTFLERRQIPLYLLALALGAGIGLAAPAAAPAFEVSVTPVLMALLYATFLGIPLRATRIDAPFLTAVLTLNFVVVPVLAYGLSRFVADDGVLVFGVLLVLLAPCIDYVIVFTGLAGGAADRLLAAAPVLMVVQMLLIPVYLGVFLGPGVADLIEPGPFVQALLLFIVVPLAAAAVTQWLGANRLMAVMESLMVPLMMATLLVVVASQIDAVRADLPSLLRVIPLYIAFLVVTAPAGLLVSRILRQDALGRRAVVFSGATRNSLVVLPLALTVPGAAVVVVTQTLVELIGMVIYVRLIPRLVQNQ